MPLAEAMSLGDQGSGFRVQGHPSGGRKAPGNANSPLTPSPLTPSPLTPSPLTPSPLTPSPLTTHHSPTHHSTSHHSPFTSLPHDPAADRRALEQLAIWCEQFSPVVGLEAADPPECLLLDVTGLANLFGGESALCDRITGAFTQRGLSVQLAIAETIGAAWAIARQGSGVGVQGSGVQGSGVQGSEGDVGPSICNPQSAIHNPQSLPVASLRISPKTVTLLHRLGIQSTEQLAELPREALAARFDPELIRRLDQFTGALEELIQPHRAPPQLAAEFPFQYPVTRRDVIERTACQLIEPLLGRLGEQGLGALEIGCRMDCQSHPPVQISVGMFYPSAEARHLSQLLCLRLERVQLPGPVTTIAIHISRSAPLACRQPVLFGGSAGDRRPDEDRRQLAALIDRLGSRLGPGAILRARPVADAQPEYAVRFEPLVGSPRAIRKDSSTRRPHIAARPLLLHYQPLPLRTASPTSEEPPGQFTTDGGPHRVARVWGPHRIETGWWRRRDVRRDYYRVDTTTGARFWIFRRLSDGRWFLQGEFG